MSAPADPLRGRTLQGELRDVVSGELYAVSIAVTSALPAKLPDAGVQAANLTLSAGVVATVAARPTSREAAWDATNRM